jgi:phage terminase large subunit-like protein
MRSSSRLALFAIQLAALQLLAAVLIGAGVFAAPAAPPPRPAATVAGTKPRPWTVEHFAAFCRRLTLDNGRPFLLEPFQLEILADYFAGYREIVVILPTGNGKTTLFAALALYHLIYLPVKPADAPGPTPGEARVYILASSKKQAGLMYDHAHGFVRRSKALQRRVLPRPGSWEIRSRRDGGKIEVVPADADTIDGTGGTLVLVDELHRHKDGEPRGALVKGLKKRQGQSVDVTTAEDGNDQQHPLAKLRRRGHELPTVQQMAERYIVGRADDLTFALHEYALRQEDDVEDLDLVKLVNPASFITVEDLRKDKLTLQPWEFARYCACIPVQGENAAISPIDWAACAGPAVIPPGAGDVTLVLDIGWKWDTTAVAPLWKRAEDGVVVIGETTIIVPPRDGTSLREVQILDPIVDYCTAHGWTVTAIVMDESAGGNVLAGWLAEGRHPGGDAQITKYPDGLRFPPLTVIGHSQDNAPISLADDRLATAIRNGTVEHPNDPDLTAHVLAAVVVPLSGGKWKFGKRRRRPRPIDGLRAISMGHSVLVSPAEEEIDPDDYRFDFLDDEDIDADDDLADDDDLGPDPLDQDGDQ